MTTYEMRALALGDNRLWDYTLVLEAANMIDNLRRNLERARHERDEANAWRMKLEEQNARLRERPDKQLAAEKRMTADEVSELLEQGRQFGDDVRAGKATFKPLPRPAEITDELREQMDRDAEEWRKEYDAETATMEGPPDVPAHVAVHKADEAKRKLEAENQRLRRWANDRAQEVKRLRSTIASYVEALGRLRDV